MVSCTLNSTYWIQARINPARRNLSLVSLSVLRLQSIPYHGKNARPVLASWRVQSPMPTIHLLEPETATCSRMGRHTRAPYSWKWVTDLACYSIWMPGHCISSTMVWIWVLRLITFDQSGSCRLCRCERRCELGSASPHHRIPSETQRLCACLHLALPHSVTAREHDPICTPPFNRH